MDITRADLLTDLFCAGKLPAVP